jgi:two-component system chemotaxis sensor kinase CheA
VKDIRQKLLAVFQVEHRDHVEQIRSLLGHMGKTNGSAGTELEEAFRRAHSLKGAARAVGLLPIEGLAHRMETLFSRVRQGTLALTPEINEVVLRALDATEDCTTTPGGNGSPASFSPALAALNQVLGIEPEPAPAPVAEPEAPVQPFQPVETVRITVQNFDGLFRSADRVLTVSQRQDEVAEKLNRLSADLALIERASERVRSTSASAVRHPEARREVARISAVLVSMERQIRTVSRRAGAIRRQHERSTWTIRQLGRQLQRDVWEARMVPAESLLEGFGKMVRDLSRQEGKEIEFRSASAGVHADRRVLEALKDPIMHLLRNAVTHGIETPAERVDKGKPARGLVTLRVETNGQRLTVAVQDDGRGVDYRRVAEVAVREGVLSETDAPRTSPAELARILLRPGFSTAETVTSLSGRGMGLSVVYEAVRRLQGDLDIQPDTAGGSAISLRVPLSIATHRLLLTKCGAHLFAIPIHGVESLRRIKVASVESVEGRPTIVLNNQPMTLISLTSLLGLDQPVAPAASETIRVMVLRSGIQRLAVAVDDILREANAVIQDLGPAACCGGIASAGVALEDGSIAFLLNPMDLIRKAMESRVRAPLSFLEKPAVPAPQVRMPSILVVDDSMTTRTLEKSILEAQGYEVRVAVDGVEALARLREERADLVIADIEMPRLNGFGLIEAMKKDNNLQRIPVIIVSSVERREDQERGLSLGADAYIVKRRFDQGELLGVIRQIV